MLNDLTSCAESLGDGRAADRGRPLITAIIPTHNGERWLATTLNSLVAQTRQDFDCILIDSSTSEATLAVAEAFRDRLTLRIEHRPDVLDWTTKTNLGAEWARTDHLCMLHQDDVWEPSRVETVHDWLAAAPDVAMHLHPSWIIDDRDRRLGLWRCPLPHRGIAPSDLVLERLIVQNFVSICSPVMRRDLFLAVGGLDRSLWYTADWDLYLKLGKIGSISYHREPLAGFRIHPQSQTVTGSRQADDFREQMTKVLHRYQDGVGAAVMARARAAIAVNTALAGAFHKRGGGMLDAVSTIAALGPIGAYAFFRDTRLLERLLPRLRLHLTGRFTR